MYLTLKPFDQDPIEIDTDSDAVANGTSIASETWVERFDTLTLDEGAAHLTQEIAASFHGDSTEDAANFAYGVIRHLLDLAGKPTSVRELSPSELPR